jgi:hypothetical protein
LKAQQIELLRVSFFIDNERGFFVGQNCAAMHQLAKSRALFL